MLTDSSNGSGTFAVEIANNSTAAITLGLVQPDAKQGETADGKIEGSDIGGVTPLDRFFIQGASANVALHLSTPTLNANGAVVDGDGDLILGEDGISGTAKIGFVGIDVAGGGKFNANLSLGLKDPDGSNNDADLNRISLAELLGALDDLDTLVQAPQLTGGGQIALKVTLDPALTGLDLSGDNQLIITILDLGNPFTGVGPSDPTFNLPDNLLAFGNPKFNLQNIIAALQSLADFLGQFETFGFLSDPLPVINLSVNDLIDVADRFATAVDEAAEGSGRYNTSARGQTQKRIRAAAIEQSDQPAARDLRYQ